MESDQPESRKKLIDHLPNDVRNNIKPAYSVEGTMAAIDMMKGWFKKRRKKHEDG